MSLGTVPVGKIIARAVEAVLAVWIVKGAVDLYASGKHHAAVNNAILAAAIVVVVEALFGGSSPGHLGGEEMADVFG